MKQRIVFVIVAVMASTMGVLAQTALVATLSHGKDISTYYGSNAFVEAYNAAEEGDCITLSSGEFEGCAIEKALTIRGAGMDNDEDTQTIATQLNMYSNSSIREIAITADSKERLSFENLYFYTGGNHSLVVKGTTKGIEFKKSKFDGINLYGGVIWFTHCKIRDSIWPMGGTENAYYFRNCIIKFNVSGNYGVGGCHYSNCVIRSVEKGYSDSFPELRNCIFINTSSVPANTYHCVALSDVGTASKTYEDLFGNLKNNTNKVASTAEVFKTYTSGTSPSMDQDQYVLTDEAQTKFLGDDGTQVGIYGGANPFTTVPSNPRIMNFSVVTNDEDGTLKVKLNVK